MFEESTLHGCSGRVGAVKEHMADVGVVQPCTSEHHSAQVNVHLLGPDIPAVQVGVRKVEGPRTRIRHPLLECAQGVGEDICPRGRASVCADAFEVGKRLASRGCGEALNEFSEKHEGLVVGAGNIPGHQRVVLRLGLEGVSEALRQKVLQQGGVGEGKIIPAARQERCCAEVLLPLVGHTALVVEFHVGVCVEELDHPRLHPAS